MPEEVVHQLSKFLGLISLAAATEIHIGPLWYACSDPVDGK